MKSRFLTAIALSLALVPAAQANSNDWISGSGKWETATNWSLGTAPSISDWTDRILSGGTNTVFIDNITTNTPSTMTISNVIVGGFNTLFLFFAGTSTPLVVRNSFSISSFGASVMMSNSALRVDGVSGGAFADDGSLTLNGGSIIVTNPQTIIGNTGTGSMTILNGTVLATRVALAASGFARGTLTMNGGTMISTNLLIGVASNGVGAVKVASGGSLFVTNAAHNAVTEARYGSLVLTGGVFTTDSLIITNPSGSFINNGGTFTITGQAQVDQGTQTVASGITRVSSNFLIGSTLNSTGTVNVTGTLIVKSGTLGIGNNGTVTNGGGVARMFIPGGTLLFSRIAVGNSAGAQCDLILTNGGLISDGGCPSGNCQVVINSLGFGNIDSTADACGTPMTLGVTAPSDHTISGTANESWQDVYVGDTDVGTLTMSGGGLNICEQFIVGNQGPPFEFTPSVGAVWINGGQLTFTNPSPTMYSIIGNSGVGQMTLSNGTVTAATVIVGNNSGNPGTLTVAGGAMTILSNLTVGDCGFGNLGVVNVAGGNLFVTNAAHNAVLDVRSGTLTVSSGALVVDKIIVTNTCTHLAFTGGAISAGTAVLDPNQSAVGDGIPNGWKQQYGLDPFDRNLAGEDPDADGFTNWQEFLAGTDPTNPQSMPMHITAIARESNNIRITWSTLAGTTNIVQVTSGTANGSYSTNNFADIAPSWTFVVGSGETSTNYVEPGGAANAPPRYYRIRLVP